MKESVEDDDYNEDDDHENDDDNDADTANDDYNDYSRVSSGGVSGPLLRESGSASLQHR